MTSVNNCGRLKSMKRNIIRIVGVILMLLFMITIYNINDEKHIGTSNYKENSAPENIIISNKDKYITFGDKTYEFHAIQYTIKVVDDQGNIIYTEDSESYEEEKNAIEKQVTIFLFVFLFVVIIFFVFLFWDLKH
jgi:hypothetical protein